MSGCPFLFLVPPYSPNTYPTIRPVMPIPSFFYCCFASFGMMLLTSRACLTRPLENHHSFPLLALYFLSYFPGFFPLVCTCTSTHLMPCILFPSCLIHTRHYVSPCKCRSYMQHRQHRVSSMYRHAGTTCVTQSLIWCTLLWSIKVMPVTYLLTCFDLYWLYSDTVLWYLS